SYTSSAGVSPLRRPGGEGGADRAGDGLVIAAIEHITETCGVVPRFLPAPKDRVSTLKELR
ncbi:hypothetical protein AB0395_44475, partial [Streptosporangium sp. NPDC051023]|uniref:hypothetical protein n=1 Tax=Streptosporangium sp. NPDC051023 TaxID=3155410 RepID=UPI00344FE3DF